MPVETEPTERELELQKKLEEMVDILQTQKAKHKQHCYNWRANNIEKVRTYTREKQREYYAKNRDKILAKRREKWQAKKNTLLVVGLDNEEESKPIELYILDDKTGVWTTSQNHYKIIPETPTQDLLST